MEGEGARDVRPVPLDVKPLSRVPVLSSTDASEFQACTFLLSTVMLDHNPKLAERMSQLAQFSDVVPMVLEEMHMVMTTSGEEQVIGEQVEKNNGFQAHRRLCTTCDTTMSMTMLQVIVGGNVLCKSVLDGSCRWASRDHEARSVHGSCHRVRCEGGRTPAERSREHSKQIAAGSRSRGGDI